MKHTILHILGCLIPLALLFILPAVFNVGPGVTFTVFFVLMFVCHLFMLRGHREGHGKMSQGVGSPGDSENDTTSNRKGSESCH